MNKLWAFLLCVTLGGCATVDVKESQKNALAEISKNSDQPKVINVHFVSLDRYKPDTDEALDPKEVVVGGKLYVPAGKGPFPAVVIATSSAGLNDRVMEALAGELQKSGYAALGIQSLAARGQGPVGTNQVSVSFKGPATDAFYALEYMRSLPIISPNKICVAGHSRGGSTAFYFGYFKSFIEMSGFKGEPFDCNISINAGSHYRPKDETTTGKPALVMVGEKDDVWHEDVNRKWIMSLIEKGENVKYVVLKDTHHGLTTEAQYCPPHQTSKGCKEPYIYDENTIYLAGKPTTLSERVKLCRVYGYHCTYGTFNKFPEASNIIIDFLNQTIGKK